MASMGTPDSGDSNLPENEVCNIINCVAISYEKSASENAYLQKEKFRAQVTRKLRSFKAFKKLSGMFTF